MIKTAPNRKPPEIPCSIPLAILDFIAPVNQEDQKAELDKVKEIIAELKKNGEY